MFRLPDDIGEVLGPEGPLAKIHPTFEIREEQMQLSGAISASLQDGRHLVAEAGTGVGKSLGYLIPAALWAAKHQKRVVISTHTKALQEQLVEKDLPIVKGVLSQYGHELKFAHLMGSENYLCVQRLTAAARKAEDVVDAPNAQRILDELCQYAETATTGRKSACPQAGLSALWSFVNRDSDICLGHKGPYWQQCLYKKDRQRALEAQILVVNHALLLSDQRLPDFHALIVDEAHNLPIVADQMFSLEVSDARWSRLLNDIYNPRSGKGFLKRMAHSDEAALKEAGKKILALHELGRDFFRQVAVVHGLLENDSRPGSRRMKRDHTLDNRIGDGCHELLDLLKPIFKKCDSAEEESEANKLLRRVTEVDAEATRFFHGEAMGSAHWVEWDAKRTSLNVAPISVAEALGNYLNDLKVPIAMVSATLAVDGKLDHFKESVGIGATRELLLGSPFDYANNAALMVDGAMPQPKRAMEYENALVARLIEASRVVKGGIFVLFSSNETLKHCYDLFVQQSRGNRKVYRQGEAPSEELLRRFREDGEAILFGVDTFWQGVDVPGEALSCVIITRLPFPNPATPIEEARKEWYDANGLDYFMHYSVPKAVIKFRQGFGRLIRSKSDRGAILVLDSRIATAAYGRAFLDSIPACRELHEMGELADFFSPKKSAESELFESPDVFLH